MSSLQIYHWVCQWKNFENRLTFGEVMGKTLVSCFFWDTVYIAASLFSKLTCLLASVAAAVGNGSVRRSLWRLLRVLMRCVEPRTHHPRRQVQLQHVPQARRRTPRHAQRYVRQHASAHWLLSIVMFWKSLGIHFYLLVIVTMTKNVFFKKYYMFFSWLSGHFENMTSSGAAAATLARYTRQECPQDFG